MISVLYYNIVQTIALDCWSLQYYFLKRRCAFSLKFWKRHVFNVYLILRPELTIISRLLCVHVIIIVQRLMIYSVIQLSYGTLLNRLSMNVFMVTMSFFLMCGFISLSSSCELELMNKFNAASAMSRAQR